MADKKNGGPFVGTPYNETTGGGASEDPNISGGGLYVSYDEVMSMHLSQDGASMESSANLRSGGGIMGGPAPGEPSPAGYSGTAESKK